MRLGVAGNCKAVVGQADSDSSHPKAVELTASEGMQPRATSETSTAKGKRHGVRQMNSMPMPVPFAEASLSPSEMPESFLGRGQLGERPRAPALMTMHQLGSHDQFVVRSCSSTCATICTTCHTASCHAGGAIVTAVQCSSFAAAADSRSSSVKTTHVAIWESGCQASARFRQASPTEQLLGQNAGC